MMTKMTKMTKLIVFCIDKFIISITQHTREIPEYPLLNSNRNLLLNILIDNIYNNIYNNIDQNRYQYQFYIQYQISQKNMMALNKLTIVFVLLLFVCITPEVTSSQLLSSEDHVSASLQTFHLRRQSQQLIAMKTGGSGSSSGGGFIGFLIGPLIFIMSFNIVWNNQRKAAIDYKRLNLASSLVKQVNPFVQEQMYSNNGSLIHITGNTQSNDYVTDPIAGVSMNNCIKIQRHIEVKQFRSRQQNDGNNHQRVSYDLVWVTSNSPQQHDRYNDRGRWFIQNEVFTSPTVSIGNYLLNASQKQRLASTQDYVPNQQNASSIMQRSGRMNSPPQIVGKYIYFPGEYSDIQSPGSLRVRFNYCPVGPTSIIAKSNNNTFQPFKIDQYENGVGDSGPGCGICCLSSCVQALFAPISQIDFITQQSLSYQEMMKQQIDRHQCITWAIRIGTYFLMVIGICLFFSPLTTLLGYVPLVGGFLKTAVSLAIFIAALIICIPLWLLTFAISWLFFHPKVGIILLVIALAITGLVLGLTISKNGG